MTAHVSPYSGMWYPREQRKLDSLLTEVFDQSAARTGPHLLSGGIGFVVPHAAPRYSGAVAAAAYRHIEAARPKRVFILGFCHRRPGRGVEMPALAAYRTPLGEIATDQAAVFALSANPGFRIVDEADLCDHSLEIQLPYLERANPVPAVVPLYVGHLSERERAAAAATIARMWRPGDLLVASSDLTHYGGDFGYVPFPNDGDVAAHLEELDMSVIDAASSLDSEVFLEALRESGATVCGWQPIALLLRTLSALDGEFYQQLLDYQTSGEITGDYTHSVSYGALGYFPRNSFELDEGERDELIRSARNTLETLRRGGDARAIPPSRLAGLARRAASFVTLRHAGRVIGCMGRLACDMPLAEAVPHLARTTTLYDPRRLPALPDNLEVEVSVLTPLRMVGSAEEIRIGADGASIEADGHSALLLPQALRPDWGPQDIVSALLRKAGLTGPPRGGYRLFAFGAQVFASDRF